MKPSIMHIKQDAASHLARGMEIVEAHSRVGAAPDTFPGAEVCAVTLDAFPLASFPNSIHRFELVGCYLDYSRRPRARHLPGR